MEPDQSLLHLKSDDPTDKVRPFLGPARKRVAAVLLLSPAALRPLGEEADDLIRSLFACGFTSASVQGRPDVGAELSAQLTTLIDNLDQSIRKIRGALAPFDAA